MSEYALSRLDSIAQEINAKTCRLGMDMFDIGKSLVEAKTLVPHGRWHEWLHTNTTLGDRMAQQMMQVYVRFSNNSDMKKIPWGNAVQMLSLPAGSETAFLESHDVENMSTREVKAAVKEENDKIADLQQKIDILQEQVDSANAAKEEAEAAMKREKNSTEQIRDQCISYGKEIDDLKAEKAKLEKTVNDQKKDIDMLHDQVAIKAPSYIEPEDRAEGASFSMESWAVSVSSFIAQNAMLPYSATAFATMRADEKKIFFREAQKLQSWIDSVMDAARNEALVV